MALVDSLAMRCNGRPELGQRSANTVPVFSLYLPRIFEHPDVDEEISGRLEAARQVNIGPVALVGGQQVAILPDIVLFLRAETACRSAIAGTRHAIRSCYLLPRQVEEVRTVPNELL